MICNKLEVLQLGVVSPLPSPQAGGLPLISCPRLLIQYICSHPPYLEAISSTHNLKTCHAVVTGDLLYMDSCDITVTVSHILSGFCVKRNWFCFRMYWVDVFTKLILCGLLLWALASWSESIFDGMFNLVSYIVSSGGS
jgi:hypothetical protein